MPEIVLELSLNRSSGVLAGIVASLAQAGVELKSQKLQRATEGRGGWLTIVGSGDSPDAAVLAERFNGTRGVEKLMRVIVDGEAVLAEGKPLGDQIQNGDRGVQAGASDVEDLPILSESGPEPEPEPLPEPEPEPEPAPQVEAESEFKLEPESEFKKSTPKTVDRPIEADFAAALGGAEERPEPDDRPEFAAEPSEESDLADVLQARDASAEPDRSGTSGNGSDSPDQVGAVLRRRRRHRR